MTESGTCNVCSAPCTSCMHFKGLGTDIRTETFSGEPFCDYTSSQHSSNKSAIVNPLKKHAIDNLHDTASETSSYSSLLETIKNSETVRTDISGEVSHKKSEKDRKETSISNLGGMKLELCELAKNDRGPAVSSSDVSVKPGINAEIKTEGDNGYISEESFDVVSASRGTSDDPAELTDVTEPSSDSNSGDESEEVVEQDVNICDICGDAGREDLLATCSGCSDGAEHTYCMQEKMEKVPEGEWFCEECRLAEKRKRQRDNDDEVGKVQLISRLRSLRRNLSLKLDSKESSVDGNSTELCTPGTQSRKRQLEKVESSTGLKRQTVEIAKDFASIPHRLSQDVSFKSGAREKVNKLNQPSHVMNNVRSHPQTHKGPLSKSNSFNAVSLKSKGKSIDDIPYKQKTHHDYTDIQDGANRLMARSMSLRPVHLGRPNSGEPKVIMLSPKSSHAPEMKGFKKLKEHLSYERKKLTIDERASSMSLSLSSSLDTTRKIITSENGFVSTDIDSRDSKATQPDEKVVPLTKLTAHATRNALDMSERKLKKPHGKQESTSGTCTTKKHISNMDTNVNSESPPPQDSIYQTVKCTENNLIRPRLGKPIPGSNLCQRCKEPITAAHVCMIGSPRLWTSEPSAVKIPVDDMEKMNPVKAALHAAFLKKSIMSKKRRVTDHEQFDEQPVTPNSNGQNCPQDVWSGSNYSKNKSAAENKHTHKLPFDNISYATGQESSINHLSHSFSLSKKMMHADVGGDGKSIGNVLPHHFMSHMCIAPTTAIPVHEYIWQGDFEVYRNGEKVADLHPGFQAHLSTFASLKVLEVVHKLSPRLSLTATPRLSAWPVQFHEISATEDNIALYFFAKDIESYERSYKVLLDNMMRNDLALKGDANGVEILIFPSSQLPQKSQRWNMLFFMWGVFRAKKHNFHCQMAGLTGNLDAHGKSCVIPSIHAPPRPVASTDSKQPDSELIGDAISGRPSSCTRSLSKSSTSHSHEEEHAFDMECEVEPNPGPNGGTASTDRPAVLGNKSSPVHTSSASDLQTQELHFVVPDKVNYFGCAEKEVDRIAIEGKIKEDNDADVKSNPHREPSIEDVSAKGFDCGQSNSNNKNHCHGDHAKISCQDSDIDICKPQVASPSLKDVKFCCSSDASETGPSISSKKIMYDLNLDAMDMIEESDAAEGFLSALESARAIDFRAANSTGWDLNSSANDVQVDGDSKDRQNPGFDLTLCADTETFHSRIGALVPVEGSAMKEEAQAASLSLSLALPFMDDDKQQSSKGRPPFLLFRGLGDE